MKNKTMFAGFVTVFIVSALFSAAVFAQAGGSWPNHDCCDTDCPGNHQAETALPAGGCAALDTDEYFYCLHEYGPSTWVMLSIDTWWCGIEGFDGAEGCGYIWCRNGNGGWTTKGVSILGCPGKMQASTDGILCYSDNNDNDRYDLGDSVFSRSGC